MLQLHIANKNYSSWSLRPWILMTELGIAFSEVLHPFGEAADWAEYKTLNPSGLVPSLITGDETLWDSLGITEYLAERYPQVWPTEAKARHWARCAVAEMHSGFNELREVCSMNCAVRVRLHAVTPALEKNLERLQQLWQQGLNEFGGPFLAGSQFSAVDAFFAPVIFRLQTYGLPLNEVTANYYQHMLALGSMQSWYAAALAEPYRDEPHDQMTLQFGTITEDLRQS